MRVMLNGTETNLRGAIKQTWIATKIYWRLRTNNIIMTKTRTAIIKALTKNYKVRLALCENLDNPVLKYWKKTCHNYFCLHELEFGLLQDLDHICKERMEADEWQRLKKQ